MNKSNFISEKKKKIVNLNGAINTSFNLKIGRKIKTLAIKLSPLYIYLIVSTPNWLTSQISNLINGEWKLFFSLHLFFISCGHCTYEKSHKKAVEKFCLSSVWEWSNCFTKWNRTGNFNTKNSVDKFSHQFRT